MSDFITEKTEQDILTIYEQLKDEYDLLLTDTSILNETFTIHCPIIVGKAHGQIIRLYVCDGMFVMDVMDDKKTKATHWHPYEINDAINDIKDFMGGKSDYRMNFEIEYITIYDTDIYAINIGLQENGRGNIIYKDRNGDFHTIDFKSCSLNFNEEHKTNSGVCVGERNILEWCYIFYTSGIKTKVIFKKGYELNILKTHALKGSKKKRFHALSILINNAGFTTFDMS